ncbi:MAG: Uma2 family endonuclease [Lyngbya sp.]|nr:Uma2 family endonuclease [Lyngbya sp.]
MTVQTQNRLTLEEFLGLPQDDITYEFVDGEAQAKMSPKYFHSSLTGLLFILLQRWSQNRGRVAIEWSVKLRRQEKDWVPVPDLLYISYDRLNADWIDNVACPVPPELAIEIISPEQSFGKMSEKAVDYIKAGVLRVWVIDPQDKSITIFYPDAPPEIKRGTAPIVDSIFQGLELTPEQLFQQAGIP